MLFRNAVFTSGVLAEKALLEEVGGFDETMGYAEDYNLWLRIACTEPLRVIGEKLLIYEGDTAAAGRQSLSSNLREMERGERKITGCSAGKGGSAFRCIWRRRGFLC